MIAAVYRMTDNRAAWLARLERDGPRRRPPGNRVGYDCVKLGWTERNFVDPATKQDLTYDQARDRYGTAMYTKACRDLTERITPAGRRALAEHKRYKESRNG